MTDSTPEPQIVNIRDRQQQLIRQRRQRFRRSAWRTLVTLGFTIGLSWAVCQPEWQIRSSHQVTLTGNQQIDSRTLEHLMAIQFPTSLIRFKPQALIAKLKANAHLNEVVVSRKLFPPKVKVVVHELPPVAITACEGCVLVLNRDQSDSLTLGPANVWLLDRRGVVLPVDSYPKLKKAQQLPALTLSSYLQPVPQVTRQPKQANPVLSSAKWVTINPQKQKDWQQMYALIEASPVTIQHLRWADANQLVLQTQLGNIRLGPYSPKFKRQLQALDELRTLSKSVDPQQIVYIDLENPENPVLELRNSSQTQSKPEP
ncbi:MAG: FtsQ-type POTRA domain-containing protein [Acaryochloris sp. CRU_2_0]|nr:FtsQ-type POTRA domain-containing protein [Acaryochloris sp. CRU_2_0]